MIPVKLQLRNFMSYRESEVLDFSGFNLAILNGDNGVGKSSLLEAMTWALWGKSRAVSDDDLIQQGQTSMWVEFIFDYEGNRYRVVRTRETGARGSSGLEFQVAQDYGEEQGTLDGRFAKTWKHLTGSTIKETQERIVTALKLDYDLFVNSSYLRQGHADEFTTKTPAERKEILSQILDLTLYDVLEEKAKERKKELDLKSELLTIQIADLTGRVGEKVVVEKELKEANARKKTEETRLSDLEGQLKAIEVERRRFESLKRERELLRHRYEELNTEIQEMDEEQDAEAASLKAGRTLLEKKEGIEKQFKRLKLVRQKFEDSGAKQLKATELAGELRLITHRENDLKSTVDRLQHVTICPTCLRVMTKKEAETIIGKLEKEFDESVGPSRHKLQKELVGLAFDPATHESLKRELAMIEGVEEEKRSLDVAQATVTKSEKIIATLAKKIDETKKTRGDLETKGKQLTVSLAKLTAKESLWEQLEKDLALVREDLSAMQNVLGGLRDRIGQIAKFEKEIREKSEELKRAGVDAAIYNDLALSFGKKGVQAMIIERTVPQIEEGANFLLQKITGGRMQVKFVTQRAKKSDESEMIETLDIEIRDELGSRPYEQFSGGEAFRINFAIRVALAKLLAMRAGSKLRFLVVDEGFGALDTSGREDIIAAISGIKEDFSRIIVVTHLEEFKNLFPTRVEVTKDSTGSHIQVFAQ